MVINSTRMNSIIEIPVIGTKTTQKIPVKKKQNKIRNIIPVKIRMAH